MPYQRVQFIGWCVNTGPRTQYVNKGLNHYGVVSKYLGNDDLDEDSHRRCRYMRTAIHAADRSGFIDRSENTLKIFMAPEFYFRGPNGAYPLEQVLAIFENLRGAVQDARFKDWLFVFGTALGFSRSGQTKEVYNVALVQKGAQGEPGSRVVMKEHKSHIDFKRRDAYTRPLGAAKVNTRFSPQPTRGLNLEEVQHLAPGKGADPKRGTGKEQQKHNYGGECLFEMDGITFGLEVCKDHSEQRLRHSPVALGEHRVQVQLVPSAGMSVQQESVVAIARGLVFNCDGLNDQGHANAAGNAHTESKRVVSMCSGTGTHAQLQDVAPTFQQPLNPANFASMNAYYVSGPGELHYYPSEQLPEASTRRSLFTDYGV